MHTKEAESTNRELVFQIINENNGILTRSEMASRLNISRKNFYKHINNLYRNGIVIPTRISPDKINPHRPSKKDMDVLEWVKNARQQGIVSKSKIAQEHQISRKNLYRHLKRLMNLGLLLSLSPNQDNYSPYLKKRISSMRRGAKKRGLTFNLNIEDLKTIISKPCVYCGVNERISVDRIDSQKGYFVDNCQPACMICNWMKSTMSHNGFLNHVTQIVKHNGGGLSNA